MKRTVDDTRRLLREAALVEFAEHGPDGTTVTRIAARAGVNKERLYAYFGDKDALFDEVLTEALEELSRVVAPDGLSFGDMGEVAGRTFDYYGEHPELARLLQWEGLRGAPPVSATVRVEHYSRKVAATAQAQRDGTVDGGIDAGHLMFMIIGLAAWWFSVPQLAAMMTGAEAADPDERARRRAFVVEAARRLTRPRPDVTAS
ncbi:TetR family transcriptional regulator [Actinacidiphila sp. DG2A-62]|uniref:TetR/AcrR family transcriptional regulator n=1 Tax=Actinacidiphila sp. DG2A-62 TaxID=3108821 RepID=UPI002DC01F7C|nr:TetR family transcriptional regulator [Actinacidiphila sp. DG2A-62]MEC3992764.1 TetR family transcriptional regulator [Actinacidiphila sp. DG2A-62]